MKSEALEQLVFGAGRRERLVGAEWIEEDGQSFVVLFRRDGDEVHTERVEFEPFLWVADAGLLKQGPAPSSTDSLAGRGPLAVLARYRNWSDLQRALRALRTATGRSATARDAPYAAIQDPVQQFLTATGETFFKGMAFSDIRRLQLDIETRTAPGYDFPNARREKDEILAIGLADSTGWNRLLSLRDGGEKPMLQEAVRLVRERDPDVIEGHNIFAFDIPYLMERARRHRVRLALGRDDAAPRVRSGRFTAGERETNYPKAVLHGRTVLDTYFMAQAYDVSHRSLPGLGLKDVARHFGLASEDRTYIRGSQIGRAFDEDPERVLRYLGDDVRETRGLSDLFAPVYVAQARMLPFAFQDVCLRGQAAKIEALMLRGYLAGRHALPMRGETRAYAGGYTDIFHTGVIRPVHHCDIRSLYPSLMLQRTLEPAADDLGIFLQLLDRLRTLRLEAKRRMQQAQDPGERRESDAMQTTFKVLINSFYGYLGFEQARFGDMEAAAAVTAAGRELLRNMIDWMAEHGGDPVEIDTDGIYFIPPEGGPDRVAEFRRALADSLPEGIDVEFDGEYEAMLSYKMKNYALRLADGEVLIKGAALKSRGLERFQRDFVREWIEAVLGENPDDRHAVIERYRAAIRDQAWDIRMLAKSERLQEDPKTYAAKRETGKRARNAALELALAADRPYRPGDTVAYYVTGTRKSVPVHANAKLVSQWDPEQRDENVAYYAAKLEALIDKFESFLREADREDRGSA